MLHQLIRQHPPRRELSIGARDAPAGGADLFLATFPRARAEGERPMGPDGIGARRRGTSRVGRAIHTPTLQTGHGSSAFAGRTLRGFFF